ncbi:MAG: tyrosine-type recombinase/integrase [Planctomycetes bacterium]|nr:tyrosine-type recombinase/integrase [Planctomycetota bacterium]
MAPIFSGFLRQISDSCGTAGEAHKRVTSHTFRHSFATHLLQANYSLTNNSFSESSVNIKDKWQAQLTYLLEVIILLTSST